jgi:catechol 2,3-dioxygenase-like lactoylglutathione lyase family enzyme
MAATGTPGIHHVTAIASDPQMNIDFYTRVLGLRLVKLTVNFDDPGAYHLYYGDDLGRPGTIMTFFSWPGARRGSRGTRQVGVTSFAVPPGSIEYWKRRLQDGGVELAGDLEEPPSKFGEPILAFQDPDGLFVELVGHEPSEDWPRWEGSSLASAHSIRGFHGVTLEEEGFEGTRKLLTETLGLEESSEEGQTFRFTSGASGPGTVVDVRLAPTLGAGSIAVGTVHHVAWRARDQEAENALQAELKGRGFNVTPVLDRQYFHSVYFPEPGGILFEIATEPPGFTADESPEELGTHLKLPPWLEAQRPAIERRLPPVHFATQDSGTLVLP